VPLIAIAVSLVVVLLSLVFGVERLAKLDIWLLTGTLVAVLGFLNDLYNQRRQRVEQAARDIDVRLDALENGKASRLELTEQMAQVTEIFNAEIRRIDQTTSRHQSQIEYYTQFIDLQNQAAVRQTEIGQLRQDVNRLNEALRRLSDR
jgi:methyl-accepting chemotaxis protein